MGEGGEGDITMAEHDKKRSGVLSGSNQMTEGAQRALPPPPVPPP